MLRGLFFGVLVVLVGVSAMAAGAGVWFVTSDARIPAPAGPAQVLPAQQYLEVPTLPVIVAETSGESTRYLNCHQTSCRVQQPAGGGSAAVYDGASWYFYDSAGSLYKQTGEDRTLLVAPTELVQPRDVMPAPSGNKVAYWLDNVTDDGEGLTELWVYDGQEGGTFVVAERLVAADIVTQPRWNSAGTALSFVVDSGQGEQEQLEFIVAQTNPSLAQAQFQSVVVAALEHAAQQGLADIAPSGASLAFAAENDGRHTLHIVRDGGDTRLRQLTGRVAYLAWLEEGKLVYAVQTGGTIEFWQYANGSHALLGRNGGVLLAASANDAGRYLALAVSEGPRQTNLRILDTNSGLSRIQSALPNTSELAFVRVSGSGNAQVGGITTELSDGQLVAFVDAHAEQIVGPRAAPVRILTTNKANTIYVDYQPEVGDIRRVLVTIRDAIHPEWVVLGHYKRAGAHWQRVQGAGLEPDPQRLYEWEPLADQWILKQETG